MTDLREQVRNEAYDVAIERGERRLQEGARNEDQREERIEVERLVGEAYLLRARRSDDVAAYRAIKDRLGGSALEDLLEKAKAFEAHADFRDRTSVANTVEAYRSHRREYPKSPDFQEARRREFQRASEQALMTDTVAAYRIFRSEYGSWDDFSAELVNIQVREGQRALADAEGSGNIEDARAVAGEYPEMRPEAERLELKLALRGLVSVGSDFASACISFLRMYGTLPYLPEVAAPDEKALWSSANRYDIPCGWKLFRTAFPASAQTAAAELAERDSAWRLAEEEGTWFAYRLFADDYPDDRRASTAEENSFRLERIMRARSHFPRAEVQLVSDLGAGVYEAVFQVFDCGRTPVGGLTQDQIELFAGHRSVVIDAFIGFEQDRELDVHVAMDQSGSMQTEQMAVRMAAIEFAAVLAMRGRNLNMSLVPFGDTVQAVHGPTRSPLKFAEWVQNLVGDPKDRGMEDATLALTRIMGRPAQKGAERVAVVLSDENLQVGIGGLRSLQLGPSGACGALTGADRCVRGCRTMACILQCFRMVPSLRAQANRCLAASNLQRCLQDDLVPAYAALVGTCVGTSAPIQPVYPSSPVFRLLADRLKAGRVRVFALAPSGEGHGHDGIVGFRELAQETGGRFVEVPDDSRDPAPYQAALLEVADQLSRQYVVRFRLPAGVATLPDIDIAVRSAHHWSPKVSLPDGPVRALLGGASDEACPPLRVLMEDGSVHAASDCGRAWKVLVPQGDAATKWMDAAWTGRVGSPMFLVGAAGHLGLYHSGARFIESVDLGNFRVGMLSLSENRVAVLGSAPDGSTELMVAEVKTDQATTFERVAVPGTPVAMDDAVLFQWAVSDRGSLCILAGGRHLNCFDFKSKTWNADSVHGLGASMGGPKARIATSSARAGVALMLDRSGQIHRTINRGRTWTLARGAPAVQEGQSRLLELKGTVPAFCVLRSGVFECSEDDGRAWHLVGRSREGLAMHGDVVGDGRNVFLATSGGLQELQELRDRELPSATILFDSGHDRPRAETMGFFRMMARSIISDLPTAVIVEGHTDHHGGETLNDALGARRAGHVANLLAELGVPRDRLVVRSYGQHFPIRPGKTPDDLARNRRVEILVLRDLPMAGWGPRVCGDEVEESPQDE